MSNDARKTIAELLADLYAGQRDRAFRSQVPRLHGRAGSGGRLKASVPFIEERVPVGDGP
jgi:hypothetical protein